MSHHPLFETHRETLEGALRAIESRAYHSAYPEVPSGKVYGETAKADGEAAFSARLNALFVIDQPGTVGAVGAERSPYGIDLGVTYPKVDLDVLLPAAQQAMRGWRDASPEARVGVCMEILHRLNRRSFELASAVMHTTGQAFMMAFQAGGPHAQDRGLEAVAYAWREMTRTPRHATWSKRVSRTDTVTLEKTYRLVPRGVSLLIGCSTFPTWNGYPGLFASLATGNAVVVKPHGGAILPLAITVEVAREVLAEQGFDPNLVTLVADEPTAPITKTLAQRPEIAIIDYTGSSAFGQWLEANVRGPALFTEKAGVNSAVIDSVDDLRAVTGNLGFTLCLYSGQMCTTIQNIFIPAGGIDVGGANMSFDDVAGAIAKAVDWWMSDPARAADVLGAIQNEATAQRIDEAAAAVEKAGGRVIRASAEHANEAFPGARVRSPMIAVIDESAADLFTKEWFGPIAFVVKAKDTARAIDLAATTAREHGAITASVYATNPGVLEQAEDALTAAGAAVSCNLTGMIWVNQAAAFSDFHVSGANPAGNATLCDGAFVAPRFRVVQSRILVPQPAEAEASHAGV